MLTSTMIFVDLETTGSSFPAARILEVGIVRVEMQDGEYCVREFSTLVNPGHPIPDIVTRITGLTDEDVRDAPAFNTVAETVATWLQGGVVMAHNVRFDYGFLVAELAACGVTFCASTLCTVQLSRRMFPSERRHNLDIVIERLSLGKFQRHRALGDAQALWCFVQALHQQFPAEHIQLAMAGLVRQPGEKNSVVSLQGVDGSPAAPGVFALRDVDENIFFVGRAKNIAHRLSRLTQASSDHKLRQRMHRVEWQEVAGELGAIRLEQRWLKEQVSGTTVSPEADLCSWYFDDKMSLTLLRGEASFDGRDPLKLYGLYRSKAEALSTLRRLASYVGLCSRRLQLEPSGRGACALRQQHQCRGWCVGAESDTEHDQRLHQILQQERWPDWPYEGAILIRERGREGRVDWHFANQWCLGDMFTGGQLPLHLWQSNLTPFTLPIALALRRFLSQPPRGLSIISFCDAVVDSLL